MRFIADTIAAVVLALALVVAISVVGLVGCGIAALLTRRR